MSADAPLAFRPEFPLDRAFAAIDEIRASGSGRRWSDRPAIVT